MSVRPCACAGTLLGAAAANGTAGAIFRIQGCVSDCAAVRRSLGLMFRRPVTMSRASELTLRGSPANFPFLIFLQVLLSVLSANGKVPVQSKYMMLPQDQRSHDS